MDDIIWLENIREAVKASKREFDVEHIIGRGTFAKVVKAKCTKEGVNEGKQFAIKILTYDVNNRDHLEYQYREIESLYRLNNSNVIKYFDSWVMQAEADNSTDVDADESMPTPQNTYSIDNNESVPISQEKYSADSSEALKTEFIARKENEKVVSQCLLNEFTLSAMKAEVERRTRVKADRQVLRQERTIDGKMTHIKIEEDEDVENIFKIAAKKKYVVVVVVIEQSPESVKKLSKTKCTHM
ncbi:eIF-2-alpha kinase GCN2 [Paramuricea clavata]|uniref:EIF-2-alpha kinase GCN2 n=1 Tax=Paramuricea clavata TaxID=317549 RepID=A0A7D9LZ29_PARCT|nr:eIF-2-alpha kinase GCN2 [Paramuricea clavata]